MTEEETVRKNLDLLNLPLDDPEMMRANRHMADAHLKAGRPVVLVKFQKPKMAEAELELLTG